MPRALEELKTMVLANDPRLSGIPKSLIETYRSRHTQTQHENVCTCNGILRVIDCLIDYGSPPKMGALLERLLNISWESIIMGSSTFYSFVGILPENLPAEIIPVEFISKPIYNMLLTLHALDQILAGDRGVQSVLKCVTTFYNKPFSYDLIATLQRLKLLQLALEECHERVSCAFPDLADCRLEATGSDGHMDGRQVFILRSKKANLVYKPRSLDPDISFYNFLEFFNTLVAKHKTGYALPRVNIHSNTYANWGTEYFVERLSIPITKIDASIYYFQMGELLFLSKLIGMGDLHQDNIIPTNMGPVAVDCECCFQPKIIQEASLAGSLLFDALKKPEAVGEVASAVFMIENDRSTDVVFQYGNSILSGFIAARDLLTKDGGVTIREICGLLGSTRYIRFVPLATADFQRIIAGRSVDEPWDAWSLEEFIANSDMQNLISAISQYAYGKISKEGLFLALKAAFCEYDIPLFYLYRNPYGSHWKLYCDDTPIADFRGFGDKDPDLIKMLNDNLLWLMETDRILEIKTQLG